MGGWVGGLFTFESHLEKAFGSVIVVNVEVALFGWVGGWVGGWVWVGWMGGFWEGGGERGGSNELLWMGGWEKEVGGWVGGFSLTSSSSSE